MLDCPITIVGHPFSSVGMGEQMRSSFSAMRAAGVSAKVLDLYRYAARSDERHAKLVDGNEVEHLPEGGVRIFHINGNEVDDALRKIRTRIGSFEAGYNVIVPAWELPVYPVAWAKKLRLFDEVWAISRFVEKSISKRNLKIKYVGQSVELPGGALLPRRYFGIRESAFVFLSFFDLTSFVDRKNPWGVVELFRRLRSKRPYDDIQLVLKVKNGDRGAEEWADNLREAAPEAVVVADNLSAYQTQSLIAACDCLASLHRAEGFGRGTGEAMFLGNLALATGWSGNTDYMNEENSLFVKHVMIPVTEGQYPHWKNQVWAEPDIDHALFLAGRALDDPEFARKVRRAGTATVRRTASHRAVGLRMLEEIDRIVSGLRSKGPPQSSASNDVELRAA